MPILVQLNAVVLLAHGQKQLGKTDALALADGPCAVPAHLQGVGMQLWAAAAAAHLQKLLTFPAGFAANGWLVLALAANGWLCRLSATGRQSANGWTGLSAEGWTGLFRQCLVKVFPNRMSSSSTSWALLLIWLTSSGCMC